MPTRLSLHATLASTSMSFLTHRHAEASLDRDALVERVGGAHGDAAAADVQRDGGGDRVAEAVRDRNAKNHARAGAPVEIAGEKMRGQRRQDVLQRGVLVDVAGDVQRRKLADLAGIRDRAAEDDNGRLLGIDLRSARTRLTPLACGKRRSTTIRSILSRSALTRATSSLPLETVMVRWPAASSTVLKRSRTNAVSSATITVLVATFGASAWAGLTC